MQSPGRGIAVQGRGAQAAALADALASLRRTRARMASLTAYGTAGGRAGRGMGVELTPQETLGFASVWGAARKGVEPWAERPTSPAPGGCLGAGILGTCQ